MTKAKRIFSLVIAILLLAVFVLSISGCSKVLRPKDGYVYYNDEKYIKLDSYVIRPIEKSETIEIGKTKNKMPVPTLPVLCHEKDIEQNFLFAYYSSSSSFPPTVWKKESSDIPDFREILCNKIEVKVENGENEGVYEYDINGLSLSDIVESEPYKFNYNDIQSKHIYCKFFPAEYDYFYIGFFWIYEENDNLYLELYNSNAEHSYYKILDEYKNYFKKS